MKDFEVDWDKWNEQQQEEWFDNYKKMEARIAELEGALTSCVDELVEHYNRAKCHHCNEAISECKKALVSAKEKGE